MRTTRQIKVHPTLQLPEEEQTIISVAVKVAVAARFRCPTTVTKDRYQVQIHISVSLNGFQRFCHILLRKRNVYSAP